MRAGQLLGRCHAALGQQSLSATAFDAAIGLAQTTRFLLQVRELLTQLTAACGLVCPWLSVSHSYDVLARRRHWRCGDVRWRAGRRAGPASTGLGRRGRGGSRRWSGGCACLGRRMPSWWRAGPGRRSRGDLPLAPLARNWRRKVPSSLPKQTEALLAFASIEQQRRSKARAEPVLPWAGGLR